MTLKLAKDQLINNPHSAYYMPNFSCYGTVMNISDSIRKDTCYWLSRIEFRKVSVTDYLGLNSKRYLLLTISD